ADPADLIGPGFVEPQCAIWPADNAAGLRPVGELELRDADFGRGLAALADGGGSRLGCVDGAQKNKSNGNGRGSVYAHRTPREAVMAPACPSRRLPPARERLHVRHTLPAV